MELGVSPVSEHQPLASTALAAKWAKQVQKTKRQTNEVGIKPRTKIGV
jgi:hypothetical protein